MGYIVEMKKHLHPPQCPPFWTQLVTTVIDSWDSSRSKVSTKRSQLFCRIEDGTRVSWGNPWPILLSDKVHLMTQFVACWLAEWWDCCWQARCCAVGTADRETGQEAREKGSSEGWIQMAAARQETRTSSGIRGLSPLLRLSLSLPVLVPLMPGCSKLFS